MKRSNPRGSLDSSQRLNSEHHLSPMSITESLRTKVLGRNLVCEDIIDSTNNLARRLGAEAEDGTVILCEQQTAGRGRMGRSWESPWGKGIWMTLILKPALAPDIIPLLTQVAGAAVCMAVEKLINTKEELVTKEVKIKWPNDILINNWKIGGILTEMQLRGNSVQYAAVGIGLNINLSSEDFPDEIKDKASSLYVLTGKEYCRESIIASILNQLEPLYDEFKRTGTLGQALTICRQRSAVIGKPVTLSGQGLFQEGLVLDIGPKGQLIVRLQDGQEIAVVSGEISLVIK